LLLEAAVADPDTLLEGAAAGLSKEAWTFLFSHIQLLLAQEERQEFQSQRLQIPLAWVATGVIHQHSVWSHWAARVAGKAPSTPVLSNQVRLAVALET
jgi:hypothetical protein